MIQRYIAYHDDDDDDRLLVRNTYQIFFNQNTVTNHTNFLN